MKKKIAAILVFALVLSGMTGPERVEGKKKTALSKKKITLSVGKKKKVKLKNNKKKVKWSVNKKKIVSLSKKSKKGVTIKGKKPGKAKVTAKVGKKKYVCTVTVKKSEGTTQTDAQKSAAPHPSATVHVSVAPSVAGSSTTTAPGSVSSQKVPVSSASVESAVPGNESAEPEGTAKSDKTTEPGETVAPEKTVQPGGTLNPEKTAQPGETVNPDKTTEPGATETPIPGDKMMIHNPSQNTDHTSTWDCVYFGNYPQSDVNGVKKDPIKWRVLEVEGNEALLISDKVLDYGAYCGYINWWAEGEQTPEVEEWLRLVDENPNNTWKASQVRDWLNSDFLNQAFSVEERKALLETEVTSVLVGTFYQEVLTNDRVFLLGNEDIQNASYGFKTNTSRVAYNTAYARERQKELLEEYTGETESYIPLKDGVYYWLITPAMEGVSAVMGDGEISSLGGDPDSYEGVRPCVRIDLSQSGWKKTESVTQ